MSSPTTIGPKLSIPAATGQFLRQTGTLLSKKTSYLLQRPKSLQGNALIYAALVLALSRVMVANYSAIKAKGTSDGPYRFREAVRTDIRELAGWTLGFGVLRTIQTAIKKQIEKRLELQTGATASPSVVKDIWGSFKDAFFKRREHQPDEFMRVTDKYKFDPSQSADDLWFKNGAPNKPASKILSIMRKFPVIGDGSDLRLMRRFHIFTPILLASIPAIGLAGIALERFTRDKGDNVVYAISRAFNKSDAAQHKDCPHTQQASTPFNQYMDRLQALRMGRAQSQQQSKNFG